MHVENESPISPRSFQVHLSLPPPLPLISPPQTPHNLLKNRLSRQGRNGIPDLSQYRSLRTHKAEVARKRLHTSKLTHGEGPQAVGVVVARRGAAGDDFAEGAVGVVGGAGNCEEFVGRVVQGVGAGGGEVGDEVGDCVGVVEVGRRWEGGEGVAWSV